MDAVTDSRGPIWQGATVLVVDNETVMRALVRRTLEAEDFEVEEAKDGESALALIQARNEPFDLVLTDLSMPGIDGRQLSETLARYRPGMAVLCMSGNPDAGPSDRCLGHARPGHAQAIHRRGPLSRGSGFDDSGRRSGGRR